MNAQGKFISTLLIADTFLVFYYFGFNSRHVLVIDPTLPPVVAQTTDKVPEKAQTKDETTSAADKSDAPTKASNTKSEQKDQASASSDAQGRKTSQPAATKSSGKSHKHKHR